MHLVGAHTFEKASTSQLQQEQERVAQIATFLTARAIDAALALRDGCGLLQLMRLKRGLRNRFLLPHAMDLLQFFRPRPRAEAADSSSTVEAGFFVTNAHSLVGRLEDGFGAGSIFGLAKFLEFRKLAIVEALRAERIFDESDSGASAGVAQKFEFDPHLAFFIAAADVQLSLQETLNLPTDLAWALTHLAWMLAQRRFKLGFRVGDGSAGPGIARTAAPGPAGGKGNGAGGGKDAGGRP